MDKAVRYWLCRRAGISSLKRIRDSAEELTLNDLVYTESIWDARKESIITVKEPGDKFWHAYPIGMSLRTSKAKKTAKWLRSTDLERFLDLYELLTE